MKKIFKYIFVLFIMASCHNKNDIDQIVKDHWQQDNVNCVIDFSTCFDFEWDTMYYFSAKYSLEEINKELGFEFVFFEDVADRVIFVYKKNIVYHQDWFCKPEDSLRGTVFMSKTGKQKYSKNNAKFSFTKNGNAFVLHPLYK